MSIEETDLYRPLMLRADAITVRFDELVALDGLDFEIPRHGIVSLIGRNGAGKTVFFNTLTGFLKPGSGTIWFNGRSITNLLPDQRTALGIARTFQNIRLFGNMTALENVMVGRHCRLHTRVWQAIFRTPAVVREEDDVQRMGMALLDFVGLRRSADDLARNLPYGAQRRLEVARAIASEPHLLLLDEPTAGMNPNETAEMIALIGRLRRERGLTVLLIEHDMRVVMRISDRVTVIDSGRKIAEGTPDEVRADPRVVETYLGTSISARGARIASGPS